MPTGSSFLVRRRCLVRTLELSNFEGVSEQIFHSMFRRCLVIRMHVRFVEQSYIDDHLRDGAKFGIFQRRPDLKMFLRSGPAIAAGLPLQHSFGRRRVSKRLSATRTQEATLGSRRSTSESHAVSLPRRRLPRTNLESLRHRRSPPALSLVRLMTKRLDQSSPLGLFYAALLSSGRSPKA